MMGIFGGMFDFNNDGELNAFEQAMEFQFMEELEREEREEFGCDEWENEENIVYLPRHILN